MSIDVVGGGSMIVHMLATSAVAVALFAGDPAPAPQAASIPLNISVTASPGEIPAGATAHVEAKLKNYLGKPVAAPTKIVVTLHSRLSADASITIKGGQSDGRAEVRFIRPGVATLVASAPGMASGSTAIVVKAEAPAPAAQPGPPPTSAGAARDERIRLAIDVLPDHVHPSNAVWM